MEVDRSIFWYNGQVIEGETLNLSINDPGLLYGATVFTTLRVYGSLEHPLTHWRAHCDRLRQSLQAFGWPSPDWQRLRQGAESLSHYPVLRITLFADGREWITGRWLPKDLEERQQQGIAAWLAEAQFCRSLAEHKTGNYLSTWLALQQAKKAGAKEAILVNRSGEWLETSTGNLWGWKDGQWWVPPIDAGILPGIMRNQLMKWLQAQNVGVIEASWQQALVGAFEAIAYTNCVMEVIPIHTVVTSQGKLNFAAFHSAWEQLRAYFRQGEEDF